jgi:uncharacterized iron-regulated membrane protein
MVKSWAAVHKWTSLACTLFLLMLCVTGLPLIFRDEIDDAIFGTIAAPPGDAARPAASLDGLVAAARERYPGEYVRVLSWEDEGAVVRLSIVPTADAPSSRVHRLSFDARSGEVLGVPRLRRGLTSFLAGLHRDLLSGLAGSLILGAMGVLFVASLVSGLVLYAPYMRRLAFGEVRAGRARRIRWLDLHNLIGIATVTWALVVGVTGAMNTVSIPLFAQWRSDVLAELLAPYRGAPPIARLSSVDDAVAAARAARPGAEVESVVFPNSRFGSPRHYLIWTRGATPLTARLVAPVLVDAETSAVSSARPLPWHLQALQVSRPLHFGDYGGLPLKAIWALLDLATIVVLASGVYLWLAR